MVTSADLKDDCCGDKICIVVVGVTASGKSGLAIELAKR